MSFEVAAVTLVAITLFAAMVLTNYTITYNTASFTINAALASVTPAAASKTYSNNPATDPAFTGSLVGFVPADGVTAAYSRTAGETVLGSPYTISAVLSPAVVLTNYTITYNTASFTINAADTTAITSDLPDPSVVGQSYTVSWTVLPVAPGAGTPTGTVTVTGVGFAGCSAAVAAGSCSAASTVAGATTLTATYVSDSANFNGSASPVPDGGNHTVGAASTITTITSDNPDASAVGQTYVVTWTVAVVSPGEGTPTGTVTVTANGVFAYSATLPALQCNASAALPGTYSLTAEYSGDANFSGSTSAAASHNVTGVIVPVHGEIHVSDQDKVVPALCGTNPANGKAHRECKLWPDPSFSDAFPEAGEVVVRLYDTKNAAFKAEYGTDPGPHRYKQIFGDIYGTNDPTVLNGGANPIGLVGSCIVKKEPTTTRNNGKLAGYGEELCGAPAATDILVLAGYKDFADVREQPRNRANQSVNVVFGKRVQQGDFKSTPTNNKLDGPLKTAAVPSGADILWSQVRDIHAQKTIRKDGIIQYADAGKTVYLGSYLEIINPTYTEWNEGLTKYLYPFILTGDSDWVVDVCGVVPVGYQIVGVYDIDGNLVASSECVQAGVAGDTKVIAFEVLDAEPAAIAGVSGSTSRLAAAPNGKAPHFQANLKITHKGKVRNDQYEMPGQRKGKDNAPSTGIGAPAAPLTGNATPGKPRVQAILPAFPVSVEAPRFAWVRNDATWGVLS